MSTPAPKTQTYINNGPGSFGHFLKLGEGRDSVGRRKVKREVAKKGGHVKLTDAEFEVLNRKHPGRFTKTLDVGLVTAVNEAAAIAAINNIEELPDLEKLYNAEKKNFGRGVEPREKVLEAIGKKKVELAKKGAKSSR
jgi:hypothetical protein